MKTIGIILLILVVLTAGGCPSPPPVREAPAAPPPAAVKKERMPDVSVLVGSLDISKYRGKIQQDDVRKLAAILQRDSIDILAMEGITRYPDIPDRVDIVKSLTAASGMRSSFGETMTLSGRQSGNAVFSMYPIRSTENTPYERLRSTKLEAAFQAIIDCGTKDLVIVSTLIPENPSPEDQAVVGDVLGTFRSFYIGHPIVVTGNLPASSSMRSIAVYDDAEPIADRTAPRMWLSGKDVLRLLGMRVIKTPFGPVTLARIGIFSGTSR